MALTQEIDGVLYNIDPRSGKRLTARNNQNKYWDFDDEIIRANKAIGNANSLISKYDSLKKLTAPSSNKGKQTMGLFDRRKQPSSVTGGQPYFTSNVAWDPTNTKQANIDLQKQADWKTKVDDLYNWKGMSKLQPNPEITLGDQMLGVDGMGYDPWKMAQDNASFGLGKFGPDGGTGPTNKDTDWLGWAGVGTGLLQGVGGIMDYFSNMRGLELTEEAMNKKYAADDRNYLAQATALNNVIDTRKDFINKTQGGRNTDFLKNIPV
jgi:hypothetical protein